MKVTRKKKISNFSTLTNILHLINSGDMAKLVNASVAHPRDLGSNLVRDRKHLFYSVCVSFEFKRLEC
jgi:hypothetical protein